MNTSEILFFSSFLAVVVLLLLIDLKIAHKKDHTIAFKEALLWSIIWIVLGLSFYFVLLYHGNWIHGISDLKDISKQISKFHHPVNIDGLLYPDALKVYNKNLGLEYLTGYLIEKSLSVDNIFVMIMIFLSFGIEEKYYHRVLFWGILGAIIMRFVFIFVSSVLIQTFSWMLVVFGLLLIYMAVKLFLTRNKENKIDPEHHPVVRFCAKYFSVLPQYKGNKFWIMRDKRFFVTPLFIVLLVIEFSDVIFAFDSVPAVFSVTQDPYIVFFSNIFAILGLRSLFFIFVIIMKSLTYLKHGLSVLLFFIGAKMIITKLGVHIPTSYSLYTILLILLVSIAASLLFPSKKNKSKADI